MKDGNTYRVVIDGQQRLIPMFTKCVQYLRLF